MARDGFDRGCGLAGGIELSDETQRWILDISYKQCSLDRLGLACASIRTNSSSGVSRAIEHPRRETHLKKN